MLKSVKKDDKQQDLTVKKQRNTKTYFNLGIREFVKKTQHRG